MKLIIYSFNVEAKIFTFYECSDILEENLNALLIKDRLVAARSSFISLSYWLELTISNFNHYFEFQSMKLIKNKHNYVLTKQ